LGDAERSYRDALIIAQRARDTGTRPAAQGDWQEGADILNALGSIEAARTGRRNRANAERYYRDALQASTKSRPARHNLALLLSRDTVSAEAEQLWRQNLAEAPDEVASRLALADYLDRVGRNAEAAAEYVTAVGDGSFPGIRRKLAAVYLKLNRADDARAVLERALQDAPENAGLLEDLGDVAAQAGDANAAEQRYLEAERRYASGADRKRVRQKRERLGGSRRV
jgi:tetratricopeptide (TPR) repeat protein